MSESTTTEQIKNSVNGQDTPMEKKTPEASMALVFLTYPLVLVIALIALVVGIVAFN